MKSLNLSLLINNTETNNISNDISVLFNQVDQMFTALNNLSHINNTLSTYGATESMLTLINADGSFASALGINIPKLTKANKSSVTASMEAVTEEAKKGIVKRIIEWIKKIIAKIKEFISKLFSSKNKAEEVVKEIQKLPQQEASKVLRESDILISNSVAKSTISTIKINLNTICMSIDRLVYSAHSARNIVQLEDRESETSSKLDDDIEELEDISLKLDKYEKYYESQIIEKTPLSSLGYNINDLKTLADDIDKQINNINKFVKNIKSDTDYHETMVSQVKSELGIEVIKNVK